MSRTIEANFLPAPVEEAKEKPRILMIDDSRDFTRAAKSPRGLKAIQHCTEHRLSF
jgi:hypothetical protein